MDGVNRNRTLIPTHTVGKAPPPPAQADQKTRGANRSTKVAGKLKVLPDQPDVPTQSQILSEPPKPAQPTADTAPKSGSDDEDGEDDDTEEQEEEQEEQDAEVCCAKWQVKLHG